MGRLAQGVATVCKLISSIHNWSLLMNCDESLRIRFGVDIQVDDSIHLPRTHWALHPAIFLLIHLRKRTLFLHDTELLRHLRKCHVVYLHYTRISARYSTYTRCQVRYQILANTKYRTFGVSARALSMVTGCRTGTEYSMGVLRVLQVPRRGPDTVGSAAVRGE